MMKVCLANLPWELEERWGIRAGCRFPNLMPKKHNSYVPFPFFLAYTASYLESKGIQVLLIDGVAERSSIEYFLKRVIEFQPDLLLVETATTSIRYDLQVLARVKAVCAATRIALCGSHVSMLPEEALASPFIDFVVMGEPEYTSDELTQAISNGQDFGKIQGLAYRNDGIPSINPRRPMISDVDALPYPKRSGVPMHRYNVPGFPSPVVYMYGSRGCPYVCNFCLWVQTIFEKHKYVPRTPNAIVNEIEHVLKKLPDTKSLFFDDDTFNVDKTRLYAFAAEMKRRNIFIPWGMNARADQWEKDLVCRLKETGLFNVRMGIESGDPEVQKRSGKALDLEEARETLHIFHEMGIKNHINFMIGLAGESWNYIENTIRFIKSVPVDSVQFTVAVPFPKTDYYNYLESNGLLLSKDWENYHAASSAVMNTEHMSSAEIEKAITYVRRRIYLTPRFLLRRLSYIRSMSDAAAIVRKGLGLLKFG